MHYHLLTLMQTVIDLHYHLLMAIQKDLGWVTMRVTDLRFHWH
jgi:hypothetical protein